MSLNLYKKRILTVLILFFTYFPVYAEDDDYQSQLIQKANKLELHTKRYWHLLLYYKKNWFGKYVSDADSDLFFLSKDGKKNPKTELEETIRSFFQPDNPNEQHPQCIFPARYKWLKRELQFDVSKLKENPCPRFQKWKSSLNPKGVTLVFSSYYMNAPASMFGHTLFKIDSKQNVEHELLDYGINYAANIGGETNPFSYAIRGTFGGFPGTFSIFPYYLKVNEYNDLESRDLWEYKFSLSEEESEWLVLHLWELGRTQFDYYFFDENCSYRLLHLLEAARPSLHLTEKTSFIVAPGETVKIYVSEKNLATERSYRPSLYSKIKQKLITMTEKERQLYDVILRDKKPFQEVDFQGKRRTLIVDAILDTYRYRKLAEMEDKGDQDIYRNYLLERSKMEEEYEVDDLMEITTPPEYAHSLSRAYIGGGTSSLGNFWETTYRVGYHDLLNSDKGHVPNSEVQFFNLSIRQYESDKSLKINTLDVVKLYSLSPYNSTAKLNSYSVDVGIDSVMNKKAYPNQEQDYLLLSSMQNITPLDVYGFNQFYQTKSDTTEPYKAHPVNFGAAYGYSFQDEYDKDLKPYMLSILPGVKIQYHKDFVNDIRYAPSLTMNIMASFENFKIQLLTSYFLYTISGNFNDYAANLRFRYAIHKNHEIRLEFNSQRYYKEALIAYHYLF
ncbi:MAG: DUF4105 domain-containing protein [Leptospiraceae bacterium]|nr:DUF4105 domain-containing protein [Leptospiraceae bacterium]